MITKDFLNVRCVLFHKKNYSMSYLQVSVSVAGYLEKFTRLVKKLFKTYINIAFVCFVSQFKSQHCNYTV